MNENILSDLLAEVCEEEILDFADFPQFKVSLRHKLAMKRIFALFEKNSRNIANTLQAVSYSRHTHLSLRKRLIIIFVLIVCAALLTGFIFGFISKNFHGTVYNDYTKLFAINAENCPETIEYEYCLTALPDGFEVIEHDSSSFDVYTRYKNIVSGHEIVLTQFSKKTFDQHFDNEHHYFEEIEINGHSGLCIVSNDNEHFGSTVVWDNDDYILEIYGSLSKNDLLDLAKSTKVLEK